MISASDSQYVDENLTLLPSVTTTLLIRLSILLLLVGRALTNLVLDEAEVCQLLVAHLTREALGVPRSLHRLQNSLKM